MDEHWLEADSFPTFVHVISFNPSVRGTVKIREDIANALQMFSSGTAVIIMLQFE